MAISEEAESRLAGIPPHLIHAITSSEDRRFFFHPGVDCHGISRAIVKYPNGGGGSTITQQVYYSALIFLRWFGFSPIGAIFFFNMIVVEYQELILVNCERYGKCQIFRLFANI